MTETYATLSKDTPPDQSLREAIRLLKTRGTALDVGAGSLRNSKLLLQEGFVVTAIDKDPVIQECAEELEDNNLTVHVTAIEDFSFSEKYDFIISVNTLSFLESKICREVISKMKTSLNKEGILYITLFGEKDEWTGNKKMSFFSKSETKGLFTDMNVISFIEKEYDARTIDGTQKFWHVFKIMARKEG